AGEEDRERAGEALLPVLVRHLKAVGAEPGDVARLGAVHGPGPEPHAAAEDRVLAAQTDESDRPVQEILVHRSPVVPGDLVVLAVGVVVAALGAADLVPP